MEKWIDDGFSSTERFFCNISHDKIKLFIYPDLNRKCRKKRKRRNPWTHR